MERNEDRTGNGTGSIGQKTLGKPIQCAGIGLHSGVQISMTLRPAPADSGIVFVRLDHGGALIPALYDRVTGTTLGTSLGGSGGLAIGTVEHLMAALWGCEIDNLFVEIDGPEVPAMDGSAGPFVDMIMDAGVVEQAALRHLIKVWQRVDIVDGERAISLIPTETFSVDLSIEFSHKAIARQSSVLEGGPAAFRSEISSARTFGFFHEVEALRAAGLAKGGSLENSIVVGDENTGVLNEGGLRFKNEFARHKVLDCVGDLYLAGKPLLARVEAHRSGHELNNALLRKLFSDENNWSLELVGTNADTWQEMPALARA
ncbi:MAG: UDP-3-O-acyl-N-acetylglucosamine deacetylase [Pseudomonadota bacterium]|nr:UDP-3-O-acyl-N-acetylglucosamine deacetylase [Pseudomonadota bacterium]